jgi:mono/diheme cytochrome c family protein
MHRAVKWVFTALSLALPACESGQTGDDARADASDARKVELGARVYAQNCATCHGAKLEGQPQWQRRLPSGRMPAPPHDESGHTWHHPDRMLFAITKDGLVPPYAPKDYQSDMPAFRGKLADDEIWAVLAYIKSYWKSREVLATRAEMLRNLEKR